MLIDMRIYHQKPNIEAVWNCEYHSIAPGYSDPNEIPIYILLSKPRMQFISCIDLVMRSSELRNDLLSPIA